MGKAFSAIRAVVSVAVWLFCQKKYKVGVARKNHIKKVNIFSLLVLLSKNTKAAMGARKASKLSQSSL